VRGGGGRIQPETARTGELAEVCSRDAANLPNSHLEGMAVKGQKRHAAAAETTAKRKAAEASRPLAEANKAKQARPRGTSKATEQRIAFGKENRRKK
jgi:hypothetical protein